MTDLAYSYEIGVDIKIGGTFQQIRGISAVAPTAPPVNVDAATYDDKGAPNNKKVSEAPALSFTIQGRRDPDTGLFEPEVEALLTLTGPDAVGDDATGEFRYYDNPAAGEPNPNFAFEMDGTVEMTRNKTGNNEVAEWAVTISGQGRRRQITNPLTTGAPTITSALPSGASAGDIVTIKGTRVDGVTGAAGVKFGSANAAAYTVVDATTIVATLPAGSAGAANIVVTHPTRGALAAFPYTRA